MCHQVLQEEILCLVFRQGFRFFEKIAQVFPFYGWHQYGTFFQMCVCWLFWCYFVLWDLLSTANSNFNRLSRLKLYVISFCWYCFLIWFCVRFSTFSQLLISNCTRFFERLNYGWFWILVCFYLIIFSWYWFRFWLCVGWMRFRLVWENLIRFHMRLWSNLIFNP